MEQRKQDKQGSDAAVLCHISEPPVEEELVSGLPYLLSWKTRLECYKNVLEPITLYTAETWTVIKKNYIHLKIKFLERFLAPFKRMAIGE